MPEQQVDQPLEYKALQTSSEKQENIKYYSCTEGRTLITSFDLNVLSQQTVNYSFQNRCQKEVFEGLCYMTSVTFSCDGMFTANWCWSTQRQE